MNIVFEEILSTKTLTSPPRCLAEMEINAFSPRANADRAKMMGTANLITGQTLDGEITLQAIGEAAVNMQARGTGNPFGIFHRQNKVTQVVIRRHIFVACEFND